jgi:hypothetical protein
MTIPSWLKPAGWGVVLGAVAWWIALAWGFGWMSPGTAAKMAADQSRDAVVAAASPYCVSRFEKQPNVLASWKSLKSSADNYNQGDFLQKGGWVALPGQKYDSDTADAIANACATQLLALKELNGVKLTSAK